MQALRKQASRGLLACITRLRQLGLAIGRPGVVVHLASIQLARVTKAQRAPYKVGGGGHVDDPHGSTGLAVCLHSKGTCERGGVIFFLVLFWRIVCSHLGGTCQTMPTSGTIGTPTQGTPPTPHPPHPPPLLHLAGSCCEPAAVSCGSRRFTSRKWLK